ncbi:MAG: ribbon-helix-helix domain-containing protein [Acidobacteria bacterium]|nr:ribbon-helix-helix domain-containing protein [Acidobacteriota bacterium]
MTISLPDEQAKRLAELCRDEGISRAEAVRRAVDRYLDMHRCRQEVFGMWREHATEGLAYGRRLREEWR